MFLDDPAIDNRFVEVIADCTDGLAQVEANGECANMGGEKHPDMRSREP